MAFFTTQVQKPGRLDEVFQRLLKVGVRINAQRNTAELPDEIVEEVDELTGAERIALVLLDEQGKRRLVKTLLPRPPYPAMTGKEEAQPDPDAFLAEIEPWLEETIATRQGFIRQLNPEAELTGQRSVLVTPLISQGNLVGVIYCDLTGCFGRFDPEDLNLLGVLANQSAVAVENAEWSATLEQKVTDRTAELKQSNDRLEHRTAELTIINQVQEGLVKQLDFQAIVDLVGDKLSAVLHTDNLGIRWYDEKTNLLHFLYEKEHGKRFTMAPHAPQPGGIFDIWKRNPQKMLPKVFNTAEEVLSQGVMAGTDASKSTANIPIIVGDRIIGAIHDENFEREYAYGESELRLLTTIAASLGSALENARLFDETQRLLKETEQRNAELAIINSVQQGLAAELDFQAIIDLVGDKLREVFKTPDLAITWYDEKADLLQNMYNYEHGERLTIPPGKPRPENPFMRMVRTHQPVVWNTAEEGDVVTGGVIPGTDRSLSGVMIPIISSDRVLGTIQVENFERDNAYGEAEMRLLTTIAASLGSALENARLFDETQRLLKETEQRNAELAIINSVQAALAAELNIQGIYDAVGDKIREIFHSENLEIRIYDPQTNLISIPYIYENNQRLTSGTRSTA